MAAADARLLADQVWALLGGTAGQAATVGAVNLFRGEPDIPPRKTDGSPDPYWDPDGRVHAYACLYASPGRRFSTRASGTPTNLGWSFQMTCVGGDDNRCLWCVEEIRNILTGGRLTIDGHTTSPMLEVGDPGPVRADRDVTPHRSYVPLLFGLPLSR